jgi:ABC-2 type transport system permease protein
MSNGLRGLEFALLRRDPALWIGATILLLLTALAAWSGAQRVAAEQSSIDEAVAGTTATVARLRAEVAAYEARVALLGPAGAKAELPAPAGESGSALSAGSVGIRTLSGIAALPPAPLAALAVGLSDVQPGVIKATARPPHTFLTTYELDNPLNLAVGAFDFAFVVVFLLPIVILAVSFDLVAGDRTSGTLVLTLAQPSPASRFLGARVLVRGSAVAALATGVWLVALLAGKVDLGRAGALSAALLLLAVLLAYAIGWFAVSLAVNAWARTAAACGVALAALWILFVVVAPAGVSLVTGLAAPAPSRLQLAAQTREAAQVAEQQAARSLQEFYFDHPEAGPPQAGGPNAFFVRVLATDRATAEAIEPTLQRFQAAKGQRQRLVEGLRFLSPALIAQLAIEDLTGRSGERYAAFEADMRRFHAEWSQFFITRILSGGEMSAADYDRLPRFVPSDEVPADLRWRSALGGTVLLALAALLVGLAFRRLARLDRTI